MDKLRDKVAIVTGGARGIGGAIAAAFAVEGADVVIADRLDESAAAPVVAEIEAAGRRAVFVPTDVSDETQVRAMVDRAYEEFGNVDILVNNAGTFSQHFFHELPVEEFDRVLSINLRAVFLCTRFVLPRMLERGSGNVINIASQLGQIGGVEMVHYSASKAGVIGLTKALAREVSTKGIRVNAIAPGFFHSRLADGAIAMNEASIKASSPIPRVGDAGELKGVAVFLAADASNYITGQTIVVDGGRTIA
jgi:3-oxoacyl-[acyl-carrier protein] reductase